MQLYLVRRDHWYVERIVWGLSGFVGLASVALSLFVHPALVVLTTATGLASLLVALSGVCVLGSIVQALGARPALAVPNATLLGLPVYRMRRDRWYLERTIYAVVGTNLTIASVLTVAHSPWWLAFIGFVSVASIAFAATGFCPVANVLYALGFEPRLRPLDAEPVQDRQAA